VFSAGHCKGQSITVAAQSKAWTVFARSTSGVVGSNPTRGLDVCLRLLCVLSCVQVAALRRADPPSKDSYRLSTRLRNWSETKRFTDALCSKQEEYVYKGQNHGFRIYDNYVVVKLKFLGLSETKRMRYVMKYIQELHVTIRVFSCFFCRFIVYLVNEPNITNTIIVCYFVLLWYLSNVWGER
jgi:hypothetical protein